MPPGELALAGTITNLTPQEHLRCRTRADPEQRLLQNFTIGPGADLPVKLLQGKFLSQTRIILTMPTPNPPITKVDSVKVTSLRTSTGRIVSKGDFLLMRYQGNLVNSNGSIGAEFDANYNFSTLTDVTGRTPFEFELGANMVIQGWEQGLLGRRVGEVIELTIPPSLGYGSTPTPGGKIPANSTLRFKVEILGAFSPDLFTPESTAGYSFATLQDLGIKPAELGLTTADIMNVSASRIGLDGADDLIGKDIANTSQPTKSQRDLILGLAGDDKLTGGLAGDFLIGGSGKNTYIYKSVKDSTPIDAKGSDAGRDKIFGFSKDDKIDLSAIDADPSKAGRQAFTYISATTAFTKTLSQVKYLAATATSPGILQVNIMGDTTVDMEIALVKPTFTSFLAQNIIL